MQINQVPGNKPDNVSINVHNAETSSVINPGQPVVLVMNGTNDGLDVVLPSTSASALKIQGLRFGVNTRAMNAGDFGNAVVFGFMQNLFLIRQTRSDSTGNYVSEPARSIGEYLTVDTAHNGFVTTASTVTAGSGTTANNPVTIYNPDAVLCQSMASYSSSASATSDTSTAITASVKAFVRMM